MNATNEQNLNPCPFCGSTKIDIGVDIINGQYTIGCEECRASISFPWKDEKVSTEAWNRRTAGCVSEQITPQTDRLISAPQRKYLKAACNNVGACDYPHEIGCCYDKAVRECIETVKSEFDAGRKILKNEKGKSEKSE